MTGNDGIDRTSVRNLADMDAFHAVQRPAPCPIYSSLPVWYRVQPGAACPVSGCVGGMPCLACTPWYLARHALLPALRRRSGCAGVGSGTPAGYTASGVPRPVRPSTTEKIKKTHPSFTKRHSSDCASLQKFQKIQKDPFQSLDCAIIS